MKNFSKKIVAFMLAFLFLFSDIGNCFNYLVIEVHAAEPEYTLVSRRNMGAVEIQEVHHGKDTPFRTFRFKDGNITQRVFCGYSEGRGHEGDEYKRQVVEAKNWKSASDSAKYGKNVTKIWQAIAWYHTNFIGLDFKDSGNDFYRYVVQTYIWCASSGYNYETALKQLAKGKGWNYTKKVKPVMDQINAFGKKADGKVYRFGQVAIYTKTKCNSSVDNKLEHQPYYRWIPVKYDTQEVSATASDSAEKNVIFNLIKLGQESEPLSGAEFKISTKNVDGSDFSVTKTTGADGRISVTLQRKYTETVKVTKKYCTNYDKLTDDQKEELTMNKIYATKDAAYAVAKKEATARAREYAEQSLSDTNYEWTVTETKAPDGYVLPSNPTRTITEFGYETKIEHTRFNSKTDIPDPDPDEPDEPKGDGSIEIWKQASHNEYDPVYSLNGAVYEIAKTDGTLTKTVTTYTKDGEEGYACASGLSPGDYMVKEITAPPGFEKDSTEYSVTIEKGITDQLKTVRSTETPSRGSLKVKKTIQKKSDGSMTPEAGVQFVLKSVNDFKDESSYEKTITTGDNGIADFTDLPFGMYQLDFTQEYRDRIASENPNITLVNLPISISIIQGSKNKYKGQNLELGIDASDKSMTDVQLDETAVTVHKTMFTPDREGNMVSEPEKNAEFRLIKKDTNAVFDTLVTDEDGNASSKTIGSDDFGDYLLKQTKGSVGYSRLEEKEFSITESGQLNFEFTGKDVFEGEAIYLDKRKIDCDPDTQKILSDQKLYEAGAKYYVLDLGKLDQAAINALKSKDETWSKEERQAFIQAHSTAVASNDYEGKGYFVTDDQGEGSILYPDKFPNGYVLIQTEGEDDHFMSVPLFSENAKESKFSVTKRTKDADGKNLQSNVWNIYAENWPIPCFAVAQFKKVKVKDSCGNTEPEKDAKFKILKSDGTYLTHPETGREIVCQADDDGIIRVPYLVQGVYSLIQVGGSAFHKPLNQDNNLFVILKSHMVYEEEDVENYIAKDMDKISAGKKAKIYGINAQGEVKAFVDQPYLSKLTISKISSISGIPLSDTVFTIEKRVIKDGKEVWEAIGTEKTQNGTTVIDPMHFVTNDDGEVTVKGLSFGRYRITEIQAKNGYLLSETDTGIDSADENFVYQTREIVINEDNVETDENGMPVKDSTGLMIYKDTSKKLTFKDSPIFGKIGLNKTGEVITSFDADASDFIYEEAAIDGAEYGLHAAEDILDEKGDVIWSKGTLIDTKVTDINGNVKFLNQDHTDPNNPDNFPTGSYYIKETKTPQGFELDNYTHNVVLSWEPKPKNDLLEGAGEVEPPYQTNAGIQQTYFLEGGSKLTDSTGLNTRIKNAKEVIFTYEKAPTGVTKYDVSEIGDGSVVLWQDTTTTGRFYVSTQTDDQVIYFNTCCDQMFYRCERLERIVFHNVDTSHMRSADKMFAYCLSLNELDLSSWDTGNLNISTAMFANSPALESIYVGTNAVTPGEEIVAEDGLTVSANHSFAYFDYDAAGVTEEEKEIKKFSAEDFTFSMLYTNGSGG